MNSRFFVTSQIDTLNFANKSLIICDVDEVVIQFLQPLRKFLNYNGYRLEADNFSLNDNIYANSTNKLVGQNKVQQLLLQFYENEAENLPIVNNAQQSLLTLSDQANIVFLSNIPEQFTFQRQQNLLNHALHFPLVINEGPKGPCVATLATHTNQQIFFLDDNPTNLKSVRENVVDVHLIQFVADDIFFNLSPKIKGVKLSTRDWKQVVQYIEGVISSNPT